MNKRNRYRKYQLTINNPKEHNFSHELIHILLSGEISPVYYCMCDEVGEEGTYHTHLYLQFQNAIEWNTIKKMFSVAHIENANGTARENRDYIRKEGKWADTDKSETNIPETFEERGDIPEESKPVTQSAKILELIKDGCTKVELINAFPSMIRNPSIYEETIQTLKEEEYKDKIRILEVVYIYGQAGVGKTRHVMDKYGYSNVYQVTDYKNPFDGYQYQEVILFDEFRADIEIKDMLKYLDIYPLSLPCRYHNKQACYTQVYIVSNIPLVSQYNRNYVDSETLNAFYRRINKVLHFTSEGITEEKVPHV